MELTIQAALLNVSDLNQSIDFYRDVFDLRVISRADRVSVVMVSEKNRSQILLLRQLGRNAYRGGRGNIGYRLLSFEVGTFFSKGSRSAPKVAITSSLSGPIVLSRPA